MTPLKEASALRKKVGEALSIMRAKDERSNFPKDIKESEVQFRYKTIEGFLVIASNDIDEMIRVWEKEGLTY